MEFKLHVVLYEPEIAGNVGSIMRTCMATNCKLHIVQPLGFFLDDRFIRRSSVNYVDELDYFIYDDWSDFISKNQAGVIYYTTGHTTRLYTSVDYKNINQKVYIVFGRESTGIKTSILEVNQERCIRIPMMPNVRSLNLANAVALVVYDVLRQHDFNNLI